MRRRTWELLARWAEQLTAETLSAEVEILERPDLLETLGLPRVIRNILQQKGAPLTPAAARVMRFDFHFTVEGWRISEVNSDVPGGFAEASDFPAAMAACHAGTRTAGDPAGLWVEAIGRAADGGVVGLLAAPGYLEDQQVVAYLARKLTERGCRTWLGTPKQMRWRDGVAHLDSPWFSGRLDALVRFYQG